MKFQIYEAKDGWRWRLRAVNGRIVADSGEAYAKKGNAERAARRVVHELSNFGAAIVVVGQRTKIR